MSAQSDFELAQKIKSGCRVAFRQFYDQHHVQLYYVAKQYLKRPSLAEDAVQEVFIRFWNFRSNIAPKKSIKSLIFTMMRNHLINELRKNKQDLITYSLVNEQELSGKNSTENDLVYSEYTATVNRGMDKLSPRKREIFKLKTQKGLTNSEIADLLNIDIKTVKTHFYNSSKFIRSYLKKHTDILSMGLIICYLALVV